MSIKKLNYQERFVLNLDGDKEVLIYTHSNNLVAIGFIRLVVGGRGPYMEFDDSQIHMPHIHVPNDQKHRLGNDAFFYDEYRSSCESNVKIYHQKNTVSYADYRVGFWYIDPFCLKTEKFENLFLPLYEEPAIVGKDQTIKIWEKL